MTSRVDDSLLDFLSLNKSMINGHTNLETESSDEKDGEVSQIAKGSFHI